MTQALLQDDFAVIFETLPVIVNELRCTQHMATFHACGAGMAEVRICTPRKVKNIRVDGREHEHHDGTLNLDFGATWITKNIEVNYA